MCDNQEETTSSKFCLASDKLDEIEQRCQPLRDYYKKVLPEEVYKFFDDKTFYLQMLWRMCPEELLYPAIDEWEKALQKDIDPLEIFLLGWHTGRFLHEQERQAEASIRGRMHRSGTRTDNYNVDPRFRKVYEEFNSDDNKKTLNWLLQREFGIKDINKPNPELSRCRSKYYRVKKQIQRNQYQEDINDEYHKFFTEYLDYLVRHICVAKYIPSQDLILRNYIRFGNRTRFNSFIHENADAHLLAKSLVEYYHRRDKKRKRSSIQSSKGKKADS